MSFGTSWTGPILFSNFCSAIVSAIYIWCRMERDGNYSCTHGALDVCGINCKQYESSIVSAREAAVEALVRYRRFVRSVSSFLFRQQESGKFNWIHRLFIFWDVWRICYLLFYYCDFFEKISLKYAWVRKWINFFRNFYCIGWAVSNSKCNTQFNERLMALPGYGWSDP